MWEILWKSILYFSPEWLPYAICDTFFKKMFCYTPRNERTSLQYLLTYTIWYVNFRNSYFHRIQWYGFSAASRKMLHFTSRKRFFFFLCVLSCAACGHFGQIWFHKFNSENASFQCVLKFALRLQFTENLIPQILHPYVLTCADWGMNFEKISHHIFHMKKASLLCVLTCVL